MIFNNVFPSINDVKRILQQGLEQMPVMHLMPFDHHIEDLSKFIVTRQMSGRYSFKPNITQQGLLFRGDSNFSSNKFTEWNNVSNYTLENVKRADFELAIESFPLYQMFVNGIKFDDKFTLRVQNPFGLASVYGYPADFIHLTSELEVALFFAVTEYNAEKRCYQPIEDEKKIGVLYAFELRAPFGYIPGLSTLGLQVFDRPGLSKDFLLQLPPKANFNSHPFVKGFLFHQNADISNKIWKKFDEGRSLFPQNDLLVTKVASFKKDERVSEFAIRRNHKNNPTYPEKKIKSLITEGGNVHIDNRFNPIFTYSELKTFYEDIKDYWENFCNQIIIPFDKNGTYMDFMMGLPYNPQYGHYFDLNKWFRRK